MEKLKELADFMEGVTTQLNSLLKEKEVCLVLTQSELRSLHEAINHYQIHNQNKANGCNTNGQPFKEAMNHIEKAKELRTKLSEL